MITEYKYTVDELKKLLQGMVILVDSREKQNQHILDYFKKHRIAYEVTKLDYGDYSVKVPVVAGQDLYFHREIVVERKASFEELSGNLAQKREQFEKEFLKACNDSCKVYLMVEDSKGYSGIMNHQYRTELNPVSFVASLRTFEHRYNANIQFIDPSNAGYYIYSTLYYYLRERLK